jgi:deazaflavin-dependent oxidoreductase (nitroreductase family)
MPHAEAPMPHASPWPPLAPAPPPAAANRQLHAAFLALNRWLVVPLVRAGLGAWAGTPVGGYVLLLRTQGRKSGAVREAPLSYLVAGGAAWVCAGFGEGTHWYRNVLADRRVEVVLPGRIVACVATDVRDPAVRERVLPALVRAVGLPGMLGGVRLGASDAEILAAYAWVPLISLRPHGDRLVAGPDDPGGTAWIWRQAVVLGLIALLLRSAWSIVRRLTCRR